MMNNQVTIKQLRQALKRWGKFWYGKELGKGFNRVAVTENISRYSVAGCSSDQMSVPAEISGLTAIIDNLRPECKRALRVKYLSTDKGLEAIKMTGFDSKRSFEFWLVKAERALLLALSGAQ
ncbi:hypothetical protein ACSLBF_04845 [Pseudoalteromonas sp. T1lg65]|uniref:hypothetical protein n=1 Tax=Pseudoalteromonas sp. T1lg65 TaxID=2077101 RepID=UPI003F7A0D8B